MKFPTAVLSLWFAVVAAEVTGGFEKQQVGSYSSSAAFLVV